MARTHFAVGIPTRAVSVNRSVDTAGTRTIALFQLRQTFFSVFQLPTKMRITKGIFNSNMCIYTVEVRS